MQAPPAKVSNNARVGAARVGVEFVHPPIARVIDKMTSGVLLSGASPGAGLLGNLASNLAASGDLPDLLKRFLEPLLRISGADAGAVRAMSDDGDQLELISSVGLRRRRCWPRASVHHSCGACGKASAGESPIWASELRLRAARQRWRARSRLQAHGRGAAAPPRAGAGHLQPVLAHGDGPGAEVLAVLVGRRAAGLARTTRAWNSNTCARPSCTNAR
jgi:hypothetical protein